MALTIDAEVAASLHKLFSGGPPAPVVGDWKARRASMATVLDVIGSLHARPDGVTYTEHVATAHDGVELPLRFYAKKDGSRPGSAALYIHGGGMIGGSLATYDVTLAQYVAATGVPLLAVEYRLAPEHPHPTPVEDCYAACKWLFAHAAELGVDPARIAVMGDSAGGGLSAGVALLARDRSGPPLAKQILIYPMLDERNVVPDAGIASFAVWSYDDNITGWGALLGEAHGPAVSPYAAPARATDVSGLPPAYVEVGTLDIFRDEDIAYAQRMMLAGVPTELHVHDGTPHGFEVFAPQAAVSKRAMADRHRVLRSL